MQSDRFRFENDRINIIAIGLNALKTWKSKMLAFGNNKEIFDAEFQNIYLAL